MSEYYNYIKSLHLIFVITWFAGLFYIPRLFIYHIEANTKPSPEKEILSKQLKLMAKRLWYIITWPSAVLAVVFAIWLLVIYPGWLSQPWMHVKLGFVVVLILYHLKNHQIFKKFQRDDIQYTSKFMRIWNEGATLILFAIVFLVILKSSFNWIFGVIGIIVLGILLMLGIKLYKKIRSKNPEA
ncbi:putative membrane protein [Maribacter dokdonensis]|uniref:Protoporphyrinogen IX oxidase n=1 Tax=Maribacter dokdonensis TaxID=320912 RepID=A0ABY0UWA5_9FLAO|nr:CopD family protein [Maribacter dokdonensis]SDT27737.1 putative membrane protein [Maribacter dokdonensis]